MNPHYDDDCDDYLFDVDDLECPYCNVTGCDTDCVEVDSDMDFDV